MLARRAGIELDRPKPIVALQRPAATPLIQVNPARAGFVTGSSIRTDAGAEQPESPEIPAIAGEEAALRRDRH
jgi:hypothetical protein